ncbi:flagellar hook-basal body complex protein [bacterium]|jgi:flagellar basal-body rod protein FlgG|nr:flagellar hook-basal body complex protein [bacterium]
MFQQFNISRSGFGAYQKMMFNITNNISNAQTPGYKQTRVELATLFPVILQQAEAVYAEDEAMNPYVKKKRGIELGTGVQVEAITKDFRQGSIQVTKNELDLAIQGHGFFQYRLPDGRVAYGRAGNLTQDAQGNLINQTGYQLDPPIRLPQNTNQITIDQEGRVFVRINQDTVPREIGQLLLARFPNPGGLKALGQNLYQESLDSGEPIVDVPGRNNTGQVVQFAKEASNVDIIREMMQMIMTQKGLELLGKAMSAGTKMLNAGMGM